MLLGLTHPTPAAPSRAPESEAALEDLAQLVLKDDQNLTIWRRDSEAMARAAQSLQALWRSLAPDVAVEHFTGDQRLALLSHINQGIAQLGLAQSMQMPSAPSLPSQIAIITNAEQLPASDVQMLQDMTRHLPGLRWRWVLLGLESAGGQNSAADASMPPSQPQPQCTADPVAVASVAPEEPFLTPTEPAAPVVPVVPVETVALAQAPSMPSPTTMPQALTSPRSGQPAKRQRLAWLGLAALLALAAWGTWFHLGGPNSVPSLAADRPAPVPAAAPATEATPSPGAAPAAAASLEAPLMPLPLALPSASEPKPIDPAPVNTAPSQAEERVASAAAAPPAALPTTLPPASAPANNNPDIPDVALRGVRWLAQQSPEFFVLEHGAFQTAAQAQSLIRTRDELANARVLMRKSAVPGGRFLVITGPFRSQERAQNYKVRENLPPQIQVRRVSDVLQESVGAAPSRP